MYYINYIVVLIFNIILTISTIFLNSVTILAYVKSTLLKSKKSYFLIMLLSVNDLLVGLFGNGSFVTLLVTIIIGYPRCEIYTLSHFTSFCLLAMSIMSLLGLNIERYLSILHPFYHRTKLTKPKLLKMVAGHWFFVGALVGGILAFGVVLTIIIRCVFALNALSTLYIHLSIYIAARRRLRVTDPHEKKKQITEARVPQRRANIKKALQNYKMAKSCAIMVGLVYICNVPIAVTSFRTTNDRETLLALWSATIAFGASSLNSSSFSFRQIQF